MKLQPSLFAACAFVALGCHQNSTVTSTSTPGSTPAPSCPTGIAQIFIGDSYLQNVCGCSETGAIVQAGSHFQCTIATGTTIVYTFVSAQNQHQLVPVAGSSFPAGPVFDPSSSSAQTTYSSTFSVGGSFSFVDAYNSSLSGTILVR